MERLYTIASISRSLSIPESTLRYRAKLFRDFLPTKGTGRRRRFSELCMERFSTIDDFFNKGMIAEDIRAELEEKYETEVEAEVAEDKDTRSEKQEVRSEKKDTKSNSKEIMLDGMTFEIKELIMPMVKIVENQEIIISELRKQNRMLAASTPKRKGLFRIFG